MGKTIRPTYPVEISIGILLLVFVLSMFLSPQIFNTRHPEESGNIYVGMFLVSTAVIIVLLVLWEEFLFPIKVRPTENEVVFRNHRNKLKTQLLIYCTVPAIFVFVYLNYQINQVRFFTWAAICVLAPVVGKLISGINNYNDFLQLSRDSIAYKNNENEGVIEVSDIRQIWTVKDERNVLHKIKLSMANDQEIMIDLDEMELEAFFDAIDKYLSLYYKNLVVATKGVVGNK